MIRYIRSATGLCLILVLTFALVPVPARADDRGQAKFIRLDASLTFGPIGKVAWNSLGGSSLEINGRTARGEQAIWNGDLIAAGDASVRLLLDSLGEVALRSGAKVRLATTISKLDASLTQRVLIATLISGDLAVDLQQDAVAYIEARGSVFSATPGARFRIRFREGRPVVEIARGDVSIEQQRRPRIKPRDVQVRPDGSIVDVATVPLKTKPNKKTVDRIRWMKSLEEVGGSTFTLVAFSPRPSDDQTAAADEPVRGRLVKFVVDPPALGSIQPAPTDARGIVTYTFNAGRNAGAGRITATIESLPEDSDNTIYEPYTRDVNIEKLGFWRLRTQILLAIAAATVVCAIGCHPHSKPINQQPPPQIP